MKTVTASSVLPCTPETFWNVFLDEKFTRTLFLEVLGYRELSVLELTDSSRKLHVVPKINLPGPLQKLIGDSFAYEEHGTLDRGKGEWTWRMVPPAKRDPNSKPRKELVSTSGTIRVEAEGEGQCRRSDEVTVEAKLFGLGGLIESTVEKEIRSSWSKEFAFLRRWLAR